MLRISTTNLPVFPIETLGDRIRRADLKAPHVLLIAERERENQLEKFSSPLRWMEIFIKKNLFKIHSLPTSLLRILHNDPSYAAYFLHKV